ncbi:MAG: hypothetical protein GTN78_25500, partial [Gemmatimonadales bacterium]|nr:hypothetical protein [Gemmatimonadales bacterium]NIN12404.1 hypothetical protein [Gemmatimonadales bacterium]NIR03512.1 hypothetical protein [Gemmatimonadales bacterium]NIS67114.1 hypothetical protein [Gemmatimonadales bacterium]
MYSNRPAGAGLGPDTLYLDSCVGGVPEFPAEGGCVDAWSDTMPGRINNRYMNISVMGIGPFPLAAG